MDGRTSAADGQPENIIFCDRFVIVSSQLASVFSRDVSVLFFLPMFVFFGHSVLSLLFSCILFAVVLIYGE